MCYFFEKEKAVNRLDPTGTERRPEAGPLQYVDLSQFYQTIQDYRLRQLFGVPDAVGCTVLFWRPYPAERPDEASYVLIKFLDTDGKTVCSCPASYEGGVFYDLLIRDRDLVINPDVVLGWSYYPFDDRL